MPAMGNSGGPDASGLLAGMQVIAGIVLGSLVGAAVGYLLDRLAAGILIGGALGLVLGFYALYLRFFKPR